MEPADLPDPLDVAAGFTGLLEGLGIRYVIGGSLVGPLHGEPRPPSHVDVLADFRAEHVRPFCTAMQEDYYVSEVAVEHAVRFLVPFNVIHMGAAVRVDVLVAAEYEPFEQERLRLRRQLLLPTEPESTVYVDIAEHSVLLKLEGFARGGEVSEPQWTDVVAMLRTEQPRLDESRLDAWASRLGIHDLLERARAEAALEA